MKPDTLTPARYLLWIVLPVMIHSCNDQNIKYNDRSIVDIAELIPDSPGTSALSLLNTIDARQMNRQACRILKASSDPGDCPIKENEKPAGLNDQSEAQNNRDYMALQRQLYFFTTLSIVLALLVIVLFFLWYGKKSKAKLAAERRRFRKKLWQWELKAKLDRQRYEEQIATLKQIMKNDCIQLLTGLEAIGRLRETISGGNTKDIPAITRQQLSDVAAAYHWDRIYPVINNAFDGLFDNFMAGLPELDEKHRRVCCIAYIGLKPRAISIVMDEEPGTSCNRLRKIRSSFGIDAQDSIRFYLNLRFGIEDNTAGSAGEDEMTD